MLKAGALLYAIFISFLISTISAFLIMSAFLNNRHIDNTITFEQMKADVNSAIELFLVETETVTLGQKKEINLFEDSPIITSLKHQSWGMYSFLSVTSNWKHLSFSKDVLLGSDLQSEEKLSLYLADHNNYLSLCGNSQIKGISHLPKLGPKRAYIEGKSFSGTKLIDGAINISEKELPKVNQQLILRNKKYLNGEVQSTDSIFDFDLFLELDSIINSFSNKTVIIQIPSDFSISNKTIIGNVIIISKGLLNIESDNYLEDILIYASEIIVESNFDGGIQLIASQRIEINKNVHLSYPSSIVLIKDNQQLGSQILIKEDVNIEGSLLLVNLKKDTKNRALLSIQKNSKIHGQVYCNDLIEHRGIIHGNLYANQFILKTASSVYENHLLDAVIDVSLLSPNFVGINLFEDKNKKEVIKCLK